MAVTRRRRAVLIGGVVVAIGVVAMVGGLARHVFLEPSELPEPYRGAHRDVFPQLDFDAAKPGSAVERVYGTFGRAMPRSDSAAASRRCVYFQYDRELSDGTLVLLVRDGTIEQRWLLRQPHKPDACSALPEEQVDLSGWCAAAAR
jgi:hypothetical protein